MELSEGDKFTLRCLSEVYLWFFVTMPAIAAIMLLVMISPQLPQIIKAVGS